MKNQETISRRSENTKNEVGDSGERLLFETLQLTKLLVI